MYLDEQGNAFTQENPVDMTQHPDKFTWMMEKVRPSNLLPALNRALVSSTC